MSKALISVAVALLVGYFAMAMYDSHVHGVAYENWVADMQADVRRLEADVRRLEVEVTDARAVNDNLRGDLEAEKKTSQLWFDAATGWQQRYIEAADQLK